MSTLSAPGNEKSAVAWFKSPDPAMKARFMLLPLTLRMDPSWASSKVAILPSADVALSTTGSVRSETTVIGAIPLVSRLRKATAAIEIHPMSGKVTSSQTAKSVGTGIGDSL